jgi:hypothetical protein
MTPVGALRASNSFAHDPYGERIMLYASFERSRSTRTAAMMITPTKVCCQ